jgi:hypothetical protein
MAVPEELAQNWPALPLDGWRDTYDTLHMWMQIVGKICLASTPFVNHFWNIAFKVTPRGLVTPVMYYDGRAFTMTFDLTAHQLTLDEGGSRTGTVALSPRTVSEFYDEVMNLLRENRIGVRIWTTPVEIPDPIPFEQDTTHHTYDSAAAHTFLQALLAMTPVFERFRGRFIGKCSPVHFFWGSFDLAVTRFSGRRAPERPGADSITREAYSHEVISHGFWPGSGAVPEPAFYAYAAPEPSGFKTAPVGPAGAFYSADLSEYILPYEAVRTAASPEQELMRFLETSYRAGADLAAWDRAALERVGTHHERPAV